MIPKTTPRIARILAVGLGIAAVGLAGTWRAGVFGLRGIATPPRNALHVLQPYRVAGTWVFDDPAVGLVREPFVAGVPEMIDAMVADIPTAIHGFRLLVSETPFPGHQRRLDWLRGDMGGNYYRMDDPPLDGWLCPAMFRYYAEPPKTLYIQVAAIAGP